MLMSFCVAEMKSVSKLSKSKNSVVTSDSNDYKIGEVSAYLLIRPQSFQITGSGFKI